MSQERSPESSREKLPEISQLIGTVHRAAGRGVEDWICNLPTGHPSGFRFV